jgi:CRISPR/Cas system CSM-associated protein Csm2 small subunit
MLTGKSIPEILKEELRTVPGGKTATVVLKNCALCNNLFWSQKKKEGYFCSRSCSAKHNRNAVTKRGPQNANWKGGVIQDGHGYTLLYNPKGRHLREHRVVWEKHNKKLLPTDIIHHIDLDKSNNNINNLMLFSNNRDHSAFHYKVLKDLIRYLKDDNVDKETLEKLLRGHYYKEEK